MPLLARSSIPFVRRVLCAFVLLAAPEAHAFGVLRADSGQVPVEGNGAKEPCPQLAIAFGSISAWPQDIQFTGSMAYRQVDITVLKVDRKQIQYFDLIFGIRYFPRNPTFWIGDAVVGRITAGAEVGLGMGLNADFDAPIYVNAGLAISSVTATGVIVEAIYRPTGASSYWYLPGSADEQKLKLGPWGGARVSFFF